MLNRRSLCSPVEQLTKRADAGEASRGCGEQHLDPERRWKRISDGADGGDRPQSRDEPREGAQLRDTEGTHRENRDEGERDENCNDGEPDEWRGLECKKIEADDIPDGGEADEVAFLRLALLIRHVEQARQHDGDAGREAPRWRKEVGLAQSKGRDHHIGEKIDDLVETLAAPARQNLGDADAPGEWTVNAVDDQGHAEPDEHSTANQPAPRLTAQK